MPKPTKRSVLEALSRPRLVEISQAFELGGAGQQAQAEFVDALVGARTTHFLLAR